MSQAPPKTSSRKDEPPFWERVVAFLGLLLVLGSLGFLFYEGIWGDHSPPDLIVEREQIMDSGADYLVKFRARNVGGETAAKVTITGTLTRNGQPLERTDTTLDYIPAGSEEYGGLYFSNDPRVGKLKLSASGYQLP